MTATLPTSPVKAESVTHAPSLGPKSAGPPAVWVWRSLGTTNMKGTDLKSVTGFKTANTMVAGQMGAINVPLNSKAYIILQEPPVPPATEGATQKRITVEPMGRMKIERRRSGGSWGED